MCVFDILTLAPLNTRSRTRRLENRLKVLFSEICMVVIAHIANEVVFEQHMTTSY